MSSYGYYDLYNLSGGWGIVALLIGILSIAVSIYLLVLAVKLMRRGIKALDIFIYEKNLQNQERQSRSGYQGNQFYQSAPGPQDSQTDQNSPGSDL